jgi:chromate transporter
MILIIHGLGISVYREVTRSGRGEFAMEEELTSDGCAETLPSGRRLLVSFLRLGLTAFGGPAMIAHIREMAVDRHRWLDGRTFKDGVALCQSIPGATGYSINSPGSGSCVRQHPPVSG